MSTDTRPYFSALATRHEQCAHCGTTFRPNIGQLYASETRYCSKQCKRLAAAIRAGQRHTPCAACGTPRRSAARAYGQLDLCMPCRDLAWHTCWRKVVHWREPETVRHRGGDTLYPYSCPLCDAWHHTKLPPTRRRFDADYLARQARLAELIHSRNFNIDIHRDREHEEYPQ
jgi:hypothetical protein